MASFFTSRIAKHVLKENAQNHFGTEDPYFDYVTPHDLNGNPGKVKKTKKATPPGLTTQEAKTLKKVTRRAYRLDNCFSICGIKIGWSAIFGIIPMLGDVFDILMALMVYRTICQVEDLPATLKSRMMFNIVVDFGIGLIPILGDVADAVFRANTRNAALLYGHLRERGQARIEGGGVVGEGAVGGELKQHKQQQQVLSPSNNHHPAAAPVKNHPTITTNGQRPPPQHVQGQTTGTLTRNDNIHPPPATHDKKSGTGWLSKLTGGSSTTGATTGAAPGRKGDVDLESGRI